LALADGNHCSLKNAVETLHDHKGELTVKWKTFSPAYFASVRHYIEAAWRDEGECCATHEDLSGAILGRMGHD